MTPQRFRLFMFEGASGDISLAKLQADPNVALIQDPSAIWGGADMLASGATETQKYQHAATKNVPWLRKNRFLNTATLSTQTVSGVTATPITVSFTGTGTITFSSAYAGSLVGTGASDRVSVTFTPAAGNLVCTVTGTVTEAQCESASTVTDYQAVSTSWPATYTALAQAAGYPISLYADRAGTTAVDTPDTVVGVQLDLSEGLVLGPELVTNGTFDSDAWWTKDNGWSIDSGVAAITNAPDVFDQIKRTGLLTVGKFYYTSLDAIAKSGTGAGSFVCLGGGALNYSITGIGTHGFKGRADAGTFSVRTYQGGNLTVDNISVREILGNHATAPSDAARPLLKKDANGKWYLLRDGADDNLPITFPNLGSNCVTYVCDGTQVIKTTGVTLNGVHNTTTPTNDYGRIYCASPPTAAREAQIIKYLKAKAGLS